MTKPSVSKGNAATQTANPPAKAMNAKAPTSVTIDGIDLLSCELSDPVALAVLAKHQSKILTMADIPADRKMAILSAAMAYTQARMADLEAKASRKRKANKESCVQTITDPLLDHPITYRAISEREDRSFKRVLFYSKGHMLHAVNNDCPGLAQELWKLLVDERETCTYESVTVQDKKGLNDFKVKFGYTITLLRMLKKYDIKLPEWLALYVNHHHKDLKRNEQLIASEKAIKV